MFLQQRMRTNFPVADFRRGSGSRLSLLPESHRSSRRRLPRFLLCKLQASDPKCQERRRWRRFARTSVAFLKHRLSPICDVFASRPATLKNPQRPANQGAAQNF